MGILSELLASSLDQQKNNKIAAWGRARIVPNSPFRVDVCGALMSWDEYGNIGSPLGWEVDHIIPKSRGGTNTASNLQALHWRNNRAKSDSLTLNYCVLGRAL